MKLRGEIYQVRPSNADGPSAFLNIMDAGVGGVCVWTHTALYPTYRAKKDGVIYLFQFQSKKCAYEYFDSHKFDFVEELSNEVFE